MDGHFEDDEIVANIIVPKFDERRPNHPTDDQDGDAAYTVTAIASSRFGIDSG